MKTKVMASQLALVLGTTLAGPGVTSALAEESLGLEEVIVTARKREENLMEIPVSVAVVDSTIIENANLADINDLANVSQEHAPVGKHALAVLTAICRHRTSVPIAPEKPNRKAPLTARS